MSDDAKLLKILRDSVDDPMWADHVEMPKRILRIVIDRLRAGPAATPTPQEALDRQWNAAIAAAEKAVTAAPVFPKKDHGGPIADGERIMILEACRKKVSALSRPMQGTKPA